MSLSQTPPPLFKQGSSATFKLVVASLASLILINFDANYKLLDKVREIVSTILNPAIEIMQLPRDGMILFSNHFTTISSLNEKVLELEERQAFVSESLLVLEQMKNENFDLRKLLELKSNISSTAVAAEVKYELSDPFSKKIVVNRGRSNNVKIGHPVISADGIVGQVTRVFDKKSEVTQISDTNVSVPVVLPRAKIRAITKGLGTLDGFELNYTDLSANLMIGDKIITSGLDGLYPAGIIVGEITSVTEATPGQFPKVVAKPSALVGLKHQVLIVNVEINFNE